MRKIIITSVAGFDLYPFLIEKQILFGFLKRYVIMGPFDGISTDSKQYLALWNYWAATEACMGLLWAFRIGGHREQMLMLRRSVEKMKQALK